MASASIGSMRATMASGVSSRCRSLHSPLACATHVVMPPARGVGRERRHQRQARRHDDAGDAGLQGMFRPEQRRRLRGRHGQHQMARLDARLAEIEFPTIPHRPHAGHLPVRLEVKPGHHGPRQTRHAGHADKARQARAIIPSGAGWAEFVQFRGETRVTRRQILGAVIEIDFAGGQRDPPRRHAPTDAAPLVEQQRCVAGPGEAPGAGKARHAGADDGDVVLHHCSFPAQAAKARR
jgi:hypothetical protein